MSRLKKLLRLIKSNNVFITGQAGTGKSHLLNELKKENIPGMHFSASTGISASLLDTITIHSKLGIGICKQEPGQLPKYSKIRKIINEMTYLIIDEISMISSEVLDHINKHLQIIRNDSSPFGGIRIIVSGDILQLKPVSGTPIYRSDLLKTFMIFKLNSQYRANNEYNTILNELREGTISEETERKLKERLLKENCTQENTTITKLYALKSKVFKINEEEFNKINSPEILLPSQSCGNQSFINLCKSRVDIEKIKVGVQVISLINNGTIFNGLKGEITEIHDNHLTLKTKDSIISISRHIFEFINDLDQDKKKELNKIKKRYFPHEFKKYVQECSQKFPGYSYFYQYPITLAYALTIHKSQGMTLDNIITSIDETIFDHGMAYVVLSRCKKLESINLESFDKKYITTDLEALDIWKSFSKK